MVLVGAGLWLPWVTGLAVCCALEIGLGVSANNLFD